MTWLVSAGSLLLSFEKVRSEFILGQTHCVILLGLALIFCWIGPRPQLAALTVGATANFKYLALIFVPYFVLKRNYRAAIASTGWFALFFALPALELRGRLAGHYVMNAVAVLARVVGGRSFAHLASGEGVPVVNSIAWSNSVSLTSGVFPVARSFQFSEAVAVIVIALVFIAIVGALMWIGRRYYVDLLRYGGHDQRAATRTNSIEWAALIVLALAFGPQTTARHMIMLTLVYIVAITLVIVEERRSSQICLVATMFCTAAALSLPFRQTGVHPALISLKSAGSASLCALLLMFSIALIGCRKIFESRARGAASH